MRLAGLPKPGESARRTNLGRRHITFDRQTQSLDKLHAGFSGLVLDAHTFKDLEIFETDSDAKSLFDYCNYTRTEGGSKLLRKRMELPWCDAEAIRTTQASIAFIFAHREIFQLAPEI